MVKRVGILTSGGDAPGMNAAIRAAARALLHEGVEVYGIHRGYAGLLDEEFERMTSKTVSECIDDGGTILYTSRCKEMMTAEGVARAAEIVLRRELDALIVIGGDGSFMGAQELSKHGVNVICIPGTIDLDVGCTDYTIGFDTAVNTAMEAIDKIRDTSASHERCSIIEVMGRHSGYIALWCGIANGAEDVLLPERFDGDYDRLIRKEIKWIENLKKRHKEHFIIINAEGIGHSEEFAARIEEATGIESRATILGYMQRGGSPTCKDRMYATIMGARAADVILSGARNRVIAYKDAEFRDYDIEYALAMTKSAPEFMYDLARRLTR